MSFHMRSRAWIAVALALVVHAPVQAQEMESADLTPPSGGGRSFFCLQIAGDLGSFPQSRGGAEKTPYG